MFIFGLPVAHYQCGLVLEPLFPLALGSVTITPYKERLAWRACLSKVIQLQSLFLLNDLNGVECAMATPSVENIDPSGPSAASDVIKCVVMFYERDTSGNNFTKKEKFQAVLNRNYKTLRRISETFR